MKLGVETIWQDRKRVLGMPLTFTKYFLSEDRLFLQTGVLNMKMEEVLLYRVSDIGVHVSLASASSAWARSSSIPRIRVRRISS